MAHNNSELRPRDGTWTAAKVDIRKGDAGVQWIICAVCNNAGPGKQCSKCQKALGEGGPMSSACLSPGLVWSPATPTRSCADCSPAQGAMVFASLVHDHTFTMAGKMWFAYCGRRHPRRSQLSVSYMDPFNCGGLRSYLRGLLIDPYGVRLVGLAHFQVSTKSRFVGNPCQGAFAQA